MPITLIQTDIAADCAFGEYCSAIAAGSATSAKRATSGGVAGVTAVTVTAQNDSSFHSLINFNSIANEPNSASWESGTWTVRIEVTTANMNMINNSAVVCRVSSACVNIAEVGVTGNLDFSTTGVKSATASGSAQSASASDVIEVVISTNNNFTMAQSFGYKPSQNIDTPVNQGVAGGDGTDFPFGMFIQGPIQTPIAVIAY